MSHLILECAVRAALIALGTAGVLRVLRVKTAGARHAAWAGVVVLMLSLPAWTAWGPKASVRLLPPMAAPPANLPILLPTPLLPAPANSAAPAPAAQGPTLTWGTFLAGVYLLGVLALLLRLAMGTLRAHALVRGAARRDGRLVSPVCAAPVTVGWLRPAVILPASWQAWPPTQLEAVLTHEGEHARRRDPLVQWLALLNRAIFWFHPLAWWLERRLSALAEEACDAAVLARGHDPYDYSSYLLELARSVGRTGARVNLVGMAMPGSSLPRRIRQILGHAPVPTMTRARALCLAVACMLVSAVFAAATVDRQPFVPNPPLPPAPPAVAPAMAPAPPPAPAPPFAAAQAPAPPAPPAPPPVTRKYQDWRLIALYFDLGGMSADDQSRSIASATQFVRSQMQSTDLAAVMSRDGASVKVWQDFTDDRDQLAGTIQRMSGDSRPAPGNSLDGLLAATKMLGALPGKKAVVYFSEGATRTDSGQEQAKAVVDAAIKANVAFYPVDARGLVTTLRPNQIAAGDTLSISVTGSPVFDGAYTVRADGVLSLPLVGDVKASGLSPLQLQTAINERAAAVLKDPTVTFTVTAIRKAGN
jgi:hypothetical protein